MDKPELPLRLPHWRQWTYVNPDTGEEKNAFTYGGTSYADFDHYAFKDCYFPESLSPARSRAELRVVGGTLYIVAEPDSVEHALASCPLPDTLEDVVAWVRMTERILKS